MHECVCVCVAGGGVVVDRVQSKICLSTWGSYGGGQTILKELVHLAMPPTMLTLMYKPWHNGQLAIFLLYSVPGHHSLSGDKFTHMLSVFVKFIKLFFLEKIARSRAVFHSWHIDFRVKFLRTPTL